MVGMVVGNEFENMWKEVPAAYFKVLSQYLAHGTVVD
jgi:hypothetical protein